MNEQELANYWNTKHPVKPVIYTGRAIPCVCPTCGSKSLKDKLKLDVKTMFANEDHMLKDLINKEQFKGKSHDETIINIQRWVALNIKYIGDNLNQGTMEYWQFPFETLAAGNGDCEDGALLIAALAINAGVPSFRVRVVAGLVQPAPHAPQGGHGYVAYLRETDNQWVAIDWCYKQDSPVPVKDKPIFKDNQSYKQIWFSFNNEFSWSNKELEFSSF